MPPDAAAFSPVMCLTQDGVGLSHAQQAARLCAAGARWVQLRMKGAERGAWLAEARACVAACREFGAVLIVNDSVEIALAAGADGVHLGSRDTGWTEARRQLGPARILGGTVNHSGDAARAVASAVLDYAGIGPFRFTATKRQLAPVLGIDGIRQLIPALRGLPAWAIGGIEPADLPALRATGAAGVAVSSALHRGGHYDQAVGLFLAGWPALAPSAHSP